ncbi:flagellar basal body-associated FliL family protein [Alkalimonas delamerensis]|uniref:Flagellar protein FliL n=1 Tax=Alkalimonas delamerensis TaxID=265981 RepID=A0ABT9GLA2_9GAMM|nr:flagellar basal body-associated FliL family protein [Alkalimonas delamerensis]MDP4527752.1 flagellar basal body-associated FliL family protein [Alkalimonas delamerensis]
MTLSRIFFISTVLVALLLSNPASANRTEQDIVYYGFDPDIVTNYVTSGRRSLGYIRVTVELMVADRRFLNDIEYHEPQILNTIIRVFNQQHEDRIKSLTGREEIRQTVLHELQAVLKRETGQDMIQDVIFTKYLYQ